MNRKNWTVLILCAALLLASCKAQEPSSPESTEPATVENLFSTTAPAPTETQPDTQPDTQTLPAKPSMTPSGGIHVENVYEDESGVYLTYDGGEMHLYLLLNYTGYSEVGLGFHLFVDGRPQAYYTSEDTAYSYMHTFYPPNGKDYMIELIFTPITGEEGDTLEFGFFVVTYPDYFLDDDWSWPVQSDNCWTGLTIPVRYLQTPPEAEVLQVQDRVLSSSLTYIDLSSAEAQNAVSKDEVEHSFYVNGSASFGYFWNVEESDTATVKFELKGSSNARFGLVVYYDHIPVSVSAEDIMYVSAKNGQKTILEAEIDLSGFDGEGVLYAVVVPRNYQIDNMGSSCSLKATGTYYFSDASSLEALRQVAD